MKATAIIGIIIFSLSMCVAASATAYDYTGAIGWNYIAGLYGIALAIVSIVKSKKN